MRHDSFKKNLKKKLKQLKKIVDDFSFNRVKNPKDEANRFCTAFEILNMIDQTQKKTRGKTVTARLNT